MNDRFQGQSKGKTTMRDLLNLNSSCHSEGAAKRLKNLFMRKHFFNVERLNRKAKFTTSPEHQPSIFQTSISRT